MKRTLALIGTLALMGLAPPSAADSPETGVVLERTVNRDSSSSKVASFQGQELVRPFGRKECPSALPETTVLLKDVKKSAWLKSGLRGTQRVVAALTPGPDWGLLPCRELMCMIAELRVAMAEAAYQACVDTRGAALCEGMKRAIEQRQAEANSCGDECP